MLENYWLVGDPDECIQQLRQLYEDAGGFGTLLVQTNDWGRATKKLHHSLELLATEVMHALRYLAP